MKPLLIVGCGTSVWDDLEEFFGMGVPHDTCCINRIGLVYPCDFDHWYSFHPKELLEWSKQRPGALLHTIGGVEAGILAYGLPNVGGSSAMQAMHVSNVFLGYDRFVLAGVPLDGPYEVFLPAWRFAHSTLAESVRSLSGNTMQLFGKPTHDWMGE